MARKKIQGTFFVSKNQWRLILQQLASKDPAEVQNVAADILTKEAGLLRANTYTRRLSLANLSIELKRCDAKVLGPVVSTSFSTRAESGFTFYEAIVIDILFSWIQE